jgi:GDP-L-fucose synthase
LNPDSKIYVAGHRGLAGSALIRTLRKQGYTELLTRTHAELDLTDAAATEAFFARERPDYVFLAAAKVGGIVANDTYPADFIRDNLAIQSSVIQAAFRCRVKRLMFLGSSCIYPKEAPQPLKEEYLLTGPLEPTNRPYALAKIAGIEMCWSYNRQHGTQYLAAMPTNLYGPGDNYDLMNSHVLPAMIRKFHLARLAAERNWPAIEHDERQHGPLPDDLKRELHETCTLNRQPCVTLWGSGTPRREFMYSDDMADACVYLMRLPDGEFERLLWPAGSPVESSRRGLAPLINIGVGQDMSIRELAQAVRHTVGFEGDIVFDQSKPDGTMQKLLDVGLLTHHGWRARTSFPQGVTLTYAQYRSGSS